MPRHKIHRYVDKLLFGKEFPQVHEAIDRPYIAYRRAHRRFFHTYQEGYVLGHLTSGNPWGGTSGVVHVWLDKACSEDKVFSKWLKGAVALDGVAEKQRKKIQKQQKLEEQIRAKNFKALINALRKGSKPTRKRRKKR